MPLDHSKATVTISVVGIAVSCINKRERNRCEIGVIRCDRHRPVLDIQKVEFDPEKIELDPNNRIPVCSSLVPHSLSLDDDISINVAYPDAARRSHCGGGTSTYMRREFDRLDDTGDDEDFRWVPDLEGAEFHNRKLKLIHESKLKPTIFIGDGILYARQKTKESFARVSVDGKSSPVPLGKFAYGFNVDITCQDGGEVVLSNVYDGESPEPDARCSVRLPQGKYTQYLITIENHCQIANEAEGTDFRLFYEVLKDPEKRKFDLRRMVETGCYGEPEEALEGRLDYSLDGEPQKCMTSYLGETGTLRTSPPISGGR